MLEVNSCNKYFLRIKNEHKKIAIIDNSKMTIYIKAIEKAHIDPILNGR